MHHHTIQYGKYELSTLTIHHAPWAVCSGFPINPSLLLLRQHSRDDRGRYLVSHRNINIKSFPFAPFLFHNTLVQLRVYHSVF